MFISITNPSIANQLDTGNSADKIFTTNHLDIYGISITNQLDSGNSADKIFITNHLDIYGISTTNHTVDIGI